MSANADLITVETYVHKGKQLKTSLSYLDQNVYFLAIWGAQGGGGGHSMIRLSLSWSPAIISPISMYMWNKDSNLKRTSKIKIQNMKNIYIFYIFGGGVLGGALHQTQGYQIFRAVRPHHRADKCITRKKNNRQFLSYMGPNVKKCAFLAILGVPGGPLWGAWGGPYAEPRWTKIAGQ